MHKKIGILYQIAVTFTMYQYLILQSLANLNICVILAHITQNTSTYFLDESTIMVIVLNKGKEGCRNRVDFFIY